MKVHLIFVLALLSFPLAIFSQQIKNQSSLTIEQIMAGEDFVGYLPEDIEWSEDSKTIYFSWNPDRDTLRSTYRTDLQGSAPVKLTLPEEKLAPTGGTFNKAYSRKVYERDGDLFLLDLPTNTTRQLTNTVGRESSPAFSNDEKFILFQTDNNLFSWEIATGHLRQLTDFVKGKDKSEKKLPAYQQWLEDDQLEMFDILRERKAEAAARENRNKEREASRPLKIFYGDKRISNMQISPDLRFVTYRLTTDADGKSTVVPDYVSTTGYTNDLRAREKVGTPQDTHEMGIYDREKDTTYTISTDQIEGVLDKPAFLLEYHQGDTAFEPQYKKPKEVAIMGPVYAEDGKAAVVIRSQDNKDRWIMLLDLSTGKLTQLDWQHDDAWIGGPGVSGWNLSTGNIGWLPDNEHLWFQSEETGFSHLYTVNINTGEKKALTKGKFELLDVSLAKDKKTFFVTANAEGPHEHHFYHLPVTGGKLEKITGKPGNYQVILSPDEKQLAVRYSYSNQPWELYLMENRAGSEVKRVTNSTTDVFKKYAWRDPEIVWFTARDNVKVPARIYRPSNPKPNGPAVIFVHGAGYLQNVHRWWSNYYREFMFHNILADNGYTVLDIDYRGSAGYGRDWRTGIYRHMGGKDLEDQVDGAKYLAAEYGIDPGRIGIYGGSYGGFITLMALFTSPGTFNSGAALRSVTDWAHYNHPYTANILNTPAEDSLAYHRSSPIYHAEGLQDNLLILHGMVDTNVHFQDVVRLAQRLIELGKDDWEFAVFPLESHGFVEPSSWTDEYKRIFKLFQENLNTP